MATIFQVFLIDNRRAVRVEAYAQLLHYSSKYLIELIQKLRRKKIYIGIKWRKYWYIFLPDYSKIKSPSGKNNPTNLPSGQQIDVDQAWRKAIEEIPQLLPKFDTEKEEEAPLPLNYTINQDGELGVIAFSSLTSKTVTQIIGVQNATYPATTGYSYGNYIFYDPNKMSTFDAGTGGTLKSTQIPQAFFEVCRALDAAENTRNGANPGLPPRRNLSTTVSFDTGTVAVAATIPIIASIQTDGTIKISGSDYLGSTYSSFNNGGGDLTSTNIVAAFLETASLLSSAEKVVTPVENQPNNIQIVIDTEAGNATVSANLPFTTAAANNGDVTVIAIDYL
ncbi:hypothetical protein [Sphaerospermopsis sp. LEGE 08334]|uniref:hypothetical protein n=1 Tax=Sphaerospermopsis sp. LEGE 08334 TaxID=1828651 RepID=UPI00188153D2|nr:hypothetical protein [Sphaerospermopsis sp. LEGE 08334]MBE9056349.1 hypothetical protein [Sphaerospermopsis sp. LEGE 08334]